MKDELRTKLEAAVDALTEMFTSGQCPPDVYHKTMVCLAYEYACEGSFNYCIELLARCSPEYFISVQPKQLLEDTEYATVAIELANMLVEAGYVTLKSDEVRATQKPADC